MLDDDGAASDGQDRIMRNQAVTAGGTPRPIRGREDRRDRSRIEIRNQPALDQCDEVLELQLALLQTAKLELIDVRPMLHPCDGVVEVTMLES